MFQSYLYQHYQLMEEFRNATHWPKHLLVQYSWQVEQEVDALGGLYVVFAICEPLLCPSSSAGRSLHLDALLCVRLARVQTSWLVSWQCKNVAQHGNRSWGCRSARQQGLLCSAMLQLSRHADTGIVAFMAMAVSTLLAYEAKLKAFMAEIAGGDPRGSSPASAAALVKGD